MLRVAIRRKSIIIGFLFLAQCTFCAIFHTVYAQQRQIYQNWAIVQEIVYSDSTEYTIPDYDRVSERYYNLYEASGEIAYLNFALHEAGRTKEEEILKSLSVRELENNAQLISNLQDRVLSPNLLEVREFRPEDIYLFIFTAIPEGHESEARRLLDHWADNLNETYNISDLAGNLKAQTIIQGYDRLNEFQNVLQVGRVLFERNNLPPSEFTLQIFDIVAYSARVLGFYEFDLDISEEILLPMSEQISDPGDYYTKRTNYASTLFRIGNINSALSQFELL